MQVLAYTGGHVVSRHWREHKLNAEFGATQVTDYLRLLEQEPGQSALALIVPSEGLRTRELRIAVPTAAPIGGSR